MNGKRNGKGKADHHIIAPYGPLAGFVPDALGPPPRAGPEDSDDEPMFVDTGLTNPLVAANMVPFLNSMQGAGEKVGLAAFVVFALRYRLRVHVLKAGSYVIDLIEEKLICDRCD